MLDFVDSIRNTVGADMKTRTDRTSGRGVARPNRTVYLSPFTNTTNPYIELQKELLTELGFRVEPFSLRNMLRGGFGELRAGRALVAVHWLETRLFRREGAGVSWSWGGAAEFAAYVALLQVLRCNSVYFVHNHGVHDGSLWQRAVSRRMIRLLCTVTRERVVHDPSYCAEYRATYLPHPLYWDAPGARRARGMTGAPRVAEPQTTVHPRLRFGILGALRPYKRIDEVLKVWPASESLTIRGKGDQAYVATLEAVARSRQLLGVSIVNQFLSEEELTQTLGSWDVVILPQMTDSMLVSGAFFEAIGVAQAIIMRDTPFARWCATQLDGVWTFKTAEELPGVVRQVSEHLQTSAHETPTVDAARLFGWQTCLQAYGDFWQTLADANGDMLSHAEGVTPGGSDAGAEQAAAQ